MQKLSHKFYNRDTRIVAQELLGKYLVHCVDNVKYVGKIVETEAYLGERDLAAHSSKGITPRTEIMFGPPGYAYVYLIYGIYHCLNVVTEPQGHGTAVLIRALEPVINIDAKTNGPGLLCRAMQIDKSLNGHNMESDDFFIARPDKPESIGIVKRPRIGVDYARHWARRLLRFYIKGNLYISRA